MVTRIHSTVLGLKWILKDNIITNRFPIPGWQLRFYAEQFAVLKKLLSLERILLILQSDHEMVLKYTFYDDQYFDSFEYFWGG